MKNSQVHIFPFLWMRGEEESVLRTELEKISESSINAVCLEARPHPDFAGDGWWHDFDIVLDEAKKRDMKIWILDDAHFPTGQANGLLPKKYPERARRYLYTQFAELTGPVPCAQVNVDLLTTKQITWMDLGKPVVKPLIDERRIVSVTACRLEKGEVLSGEVVDLTEDIRDGILTWDIPAGTWRIHVNFVTTDFGVNPEYINYIDEDSVKVLIESVYEPHYERYKDEFGKTILGFFSDEPGFYNTNGLEMNDKIGTKLMPLPWGKEMEKMFAEACGDDWKEKIPYLWYEDADGEFSDLRFHYMDCVSRLYAKNFSGQLGRWCREHGVEYVGHVVEDGRQHSRLGSGAAHYFRAMLGQDMAGIDNIGNQLIPGNPDSSRHNGAILWDPTFYHFGIGKLGASAAAIDPKKQGRLLCENFGAYGWSLGIKNMKWMVDSFIAQGVNRFVPHAFSMAEYPDDDCPPHYYARGNNPQFPFFGKLMEYTDRLCQIFDGGMNVPQAAVLYEAEADWAGETMPFYAPGRELLEHQIDYEVIPADVFEDSEYYGTKVENGSLIVNGRCMKALIIPQADHISEEAVKFITANSDLNVIFVNSRPKAVTGGKFSADVLEKYPAVPLEELADTLRNAGIFDIQTENKYKTLSVYHYKKEKDFYYFFNTSLSETISTEVTLRENGCFGMYDAMTDRWYKADQKGSSFRLELKPYESVVLAVDPDHGLEENLKARSTGAVDISGSWKFRMCPAGSKEWTEMEEMDSLRPVSEKYRDFSGVMEYTKMVNVKKDGSRYIFSPQYVFECMEVSVNGAAAGTKICPPYDVDITDALTDGENEIRVRVVNTLLRDANTKPGIFGPDRAVMEPSGMFGTICLVKERMHDPAE